MHPPFAKSMGTQCRARRDDGARCQYERGHEGPHTNAMGKSWETARPEVMKHARESMKKNRKLLVLLAHEGASAHIGQPPRERVIPNKRKKAPKHKKMNFMEM